MGFLAFQIYVEVALKNSINEKPFHWLQLCESCEALFTAPKDSSETNSIDAAVLREVEIWVSRT